MDFDIVNFDIFRRKPNFLKLCDHGHRLFVNFQTKSRRFREKRLI
jgi:hypothetical protein